MNINLRFKCALCRPSNNLLIMKVQKLQLVTSDQPSKVSKAVNKLYILLRTACCYKTFATMNLHEHFSDTLCPESEILCINVL